MRYHIALHRPFDLAKFSQAAERRQRPRHAMWELSQRLKATIHIPDIDSPSLGDKLQASIAGRPEHWAMAHTLSDQVGPNDWIFCNSEEVGIPVATVCGSRRDRPKIAVFIHNLDRPKGRLALKLFNLRDRIDLFFACTRSQSDFLRQYLNLPEKRVCFVWEQTDTQFFTPDSASPSKLRPIIASVGLEQRDYRTLAAATSNLEVDVKISGFSHDATALAKVFPETLPANMSRRFYEWPELLQLYRDADVVVVSLVKNRYAAGVQALMEAMACRRPVIVTQTQGLQDYLVPEAVTCVAPGDVAGMRQAIAQLLNHPQVAEAQAERGYQVALERHTSEQYIQAIARKLETFSESKQPLIRATV